jgi:ubiquinone/menaquinone biosynthesis C-methylase UbiE
MPVDTPRLTEVTQKVRAFYEETSFPGYEEYDSPLALVDKARRGLYARMLDDQIPYTARVLDVGCGTGQLPIFLSLNRRRTVGCDLSFGSLAKGQGFKREFGLRHVSFVQGNLFALPLRSAAFDVVFCTGVLHHTADARAGFREVARLVKPGGFVILGLYNSYARVPLAARRVLFRLSRRRFTGLDGYLRSQRSGREKSRIWYLDQYEHPHEEMFSADDVLGWFHDAGIEYVASVPPLQVGRGLGGGERLFEPSSLPGRLERVLAQLGWMMTIGWEGGLFVMIGRRAR